MFAIQGYRRYPKHERLFLPWSNQNAIIAGTCVRNNDKWYEQKAVTGQQDYFNKCVATAVKFAISPRHFGSSHVLVLLFTSHIDLIVNIYSKILSSIPWQEKEIIKRTQLVFDLRASSGYWESRGTFWFYPAHARYNWFPAIDEEIDAIVRSFVARNSNIYTLLQEARSSTFRILPLLEESIY